MYNYTLSDTDIVTYMLYHVFSNKKVGSNKKISLWLVSGYLVILSIICFIIDSMDMSIVLLVLALLYILFAVFWREKLLNRTYKKLALKQLKDMIGSQVQLEIKEDHLYVTDQAGVYKYLFSGFISVSELSSHYFIKMNNAHSIIIPKLSAGMEQEMNQTIADRNLPYLSELTWRP